jgi:hypothetical protein
MKEVFIDSTSLRGINGKSEDASYPNIGRLGAVD